MGWSAGLRTEGFVEVCTLSLDAQLPVWNVAARLHPQVGLEESTPGTRAGLQRKEPGSPGVKLTSLQAQPTGTVFLGLRPRYE